MFTSQMIRCRIVTLLVCDKLERILKKTIVT